MCRKLKINSINIINSNLTLRYDVKRRRIREIGEFLQNLSAYIFKKRRLIYIVI